VRLKTLDFRNLSTSNRNAPMSKQVGAACSPTSFQPYCRSRLFGARCLKSLGGSRATTSSPFSPQCLFLVRAKQSFGAYYRASHRSRGQSFIETIRFAAANRLLVNIDYRDQKGNRFTRAIEAYSLRRSKAGDVALDGRPRRGRATPQLSLDSILGVR